MKTIVTLAILYVVITATIFYQLSIPKEYTYLPEVITKKEAYNSLTMAEKKVLIDMEDEPVASGSYINSNAPGTYICKQCDNPLFSSEKKLINHVGWASFSLPIEKATTTTVNFGEKNLRVHCSNCKGYLGLKCHITQNDSMVVHHNINSIAIRFIPAPRFATVHSGDALSYMLGIQD